ncbi:hypothetical protein [Streptococcus orisasini]|uniref:hypothetical protein n=1 Tax=Streptococcus orisasini TaxID=1080071 RepID=UPI0007102D63|nr:hypothetical protein [Streptococcus orisasini]
MKYINALKNSFITELKILFRYKKTLASEIIVFLAIYIGILVFGDTNVFSNFYHVKYTDGPVLLLIGYIFWSFSNMALGYSSSVVSSDAKTGLLEVKMQGILPYSILTFIPVLVTILESLLLLFVVCLISVFIGFISISSIPFLLFSVFLTFPSIVGMYGFGLILGGLALKEKNIGQFVSIISGILLFTTNTFIVNLPYYIYIIPFTSGIDICRKFYSNSNFDFKLVLVYLLVCIIWLIAGLLTFNYFLKKERLFGSFDNF